MCFIIKANKINAKLILLHQNHYSLHKLIDLIKDTKSPLTLARFQEKISQLDFTEECNEDDGGETDDK